MSKRLFRRAVTTILGLGLAIGAAAAAVTPAHAATITAATARTAAATSVDSGPAPVCSSSPKICEPQTWWVPTKTITNDGLLQLLPTSVEANTTSKSTQMSQTVTVTGSLTATLTGTIPVAPPTTAAVTPGGQAQVSGSDAEEGTVQVPAHGVGYLKFGIIYDKIQGIAYYRHTDGTVTSETEVATVPIGFGYIASDANIAHNTVIVTKK